MELFLVHGTEFIRLPPDFLVGPTAPDAHLIFQDARGRALELPLRRGAQGCAMNSSRPRVGAALGAWISRRQSGPRGCPLPEPHHLEPVSAGEFAVAASLASSPSVCLRLPAGQGLRLRATTAWPTAAPLGFWVWAMCGGHAGSALDSGGVGRLPMQE